MGKKIIITIGREYGSGGKEIGKKLSKALGIPYYDKELLRVASQNSGFSEEAFLNNRDKQSEGGFFYSLVMGAYGFSHLPISHKLFLEQFDAIREIAAKGSCILIGRCADYALDGYEECLKVFIHGNIRHRIHRAIAKYGIDSEKAEEIVTKMDKARATYYNFYSGKEWGDALGYDITVDSSILGIDNVVKLISEYIYRKDYYNTP